MTANSPDTFITTFLAFVWGCAIACLAFMMLGAGHGWVDAAFSSVAIFLMPLAVLGWSYRGKNLGYLIAYIVLLLAVTVDAYLCTHTESLDKVWAVAAFVLILWAILWFGWQVLFIWTMLRRE